jgi:hemolysin activation/secretion protein
MLKLYTAIPVALICFCPPVRAQLPPTESPRLPPNVPTPEKPIDVPFEKVPKSPFLNDQLTPVKVTEFVFLGNTVFEAKELLEITNPYLGRIISQVEIANITSKITSLYQSKGFLTSGAVFLMKDNADLIDSQNAKIVIRLIEDKLDKVSVTGSKRISRYVKQRITSDKPLSTSRLLEELRILNGDPLIKPKSLKAKLLPNANNIINRSSLEVSLEHAKAYDVSLYINNYANSGIGTLREGLDFTALNPTMRGDKLKLNYSRTDGSNVLFTEYSIPFGKLLFNFAYSYGSNTTIEEPFRILDIQGTSQSYSLGASYLIMQNYNDKGYEDLAISLDFTRRESEEKILDIPFAVSQGADFEGRTKTNALVFGIDYKAIREVEAVILRAQLRLGLDLYSRTDPLFDKGEFLAARFDGVYTHKLPASLSFLSRFSSQIADRPLIAGEQFSLGGVYSVRGYRQDVFLADTGVFGSVGISIPVYNGKIGTLSLMPFVDVGYGNSYLSNQTALLAGAGLSLEYRFSDRVSAELSWGYPLLKTDSDRESKNFQDSGVYFSIRTALL